MSYMFTKETTFGKCQDRVYFVKNKSRILILKLGLHLNNANFFKDQRRPSSRRVAVMLIRVTPFIIII